MNTHFNSIENVSHLSRLVYSHIKYGVITKTKETKIKNKKILSHNKNKQTKKKTWKRAKLIKYKYKWTHMVPVLKETRGLTHVK